MESLGLGLFMASACGFGMLLYHPASPVVRRLPQEILRRMLMGLAMGATAIGLIYSPWGERSGAHLNPAVTLTFYSMGKIAGVDAVFYTLAQFLGGAAGVTLLALIARKPLSHAEVNYIVTMPGPKGKLIAFGAEFTIAFLLMTVVLIATNSPMLAPFTGIISGVCVMVFIICEAPLSGMSMNPARTLASALIPQAWNGLWIYFTAPPLAMLIAAALFTRVSPATACAKLHHSISARCIFCEFQKSQKETPN